MGVPQSVYEDQELEYCKILDNLINDIDNDDICTLLLAIGYMGRPSNRSNILSYIYSNPLIIPMYISVKDYLKVYCNILTYEELVIDMDKHLMSNKIDTKDIFEGVRNYVVYLKKYIDNNGIILKD